MKLTMYCAVICLIIALTIMTRPSTNGVHAKPIPGYLTKAQRYHVPDQHQRFRRDSESDSSEEKDSEENDSEENDSEETESSQGIIVPTCLPGWSQNGTSCYLFVGSFVTWGVALNDCLAMGSDLVEITSFAEQEFVDSLTAGENVWLGLNDITTEGTFVWASGEAVSFTNWLSAYPADEDPLFDCVVTFSYYSSWFNTWCSSTIPYMCERQA